MKIRVLQIGNYGVGKTFMVSNYLGNYTFNTSPTVGVEFNCIFKKNNSNEIKIHLWDCAGAERFRSIIRAYYSNCDIYLIFFDANNISYREEINLWLNEVKNSITDNKRILLIGNYKKNIDYNLQKDIICYLKEIKMECIFISEFTDFNNVLNRVIELYLQILKDSNEKSNLETPLISKNKNKRCLDVLFPCL